MKTIINKTFGLIFGSMLLAFTSSNAFASHNCVDSQACSATTPEGCKQQRCTCNKHHHDCIWLKNLIGKDGKCKPHSTCSG